MADHRLVEEWMGEPVETLEDMLRPQLRAVCVGINPSTVSVDAGHYYQGQLGQRFFARLRRVGMLARTIDGFEDDTLYASGVGFTDIVKRATRRGEELNAAEFAHGRPLLISKLDRCAPLLVIFTFKQAAEKLHGRFDGAGFQSFGSPDRASFVMPGPMAPADMADRELDELERYVDDHGWSVS